jgi:hypothetical protein
MSKSQKALKKRTTREVEVVTPGGEGEGEGEGAGEGDGVKEHRRKRRKSAADSFRSG